MASGQTSDTRDADLQQMSRHLVGLSTAMRLRVSAGLLERGHDLRPSTAQVIPNLPEEGLRMSDLAARLRLTLQRTGQLVADLEEVGYLAREADPTDGRAKVVVYTDRGLALIKDIDEIGRETTEAFAAELGARRLAQLCGLLAELDVAINGADAPIRVEPHERGERERS
ncbi:MAG: hypothetical protein CL908_20665 [Deltaproteobacteria bacterium]|nr:hypothetical protein [Deltaproteobacteria bacterium]